MIFNYLENYLYKNEKDDHTNLNIIMIIIKYTTNNVLIKITDEIFVVGCDRDESFKLETNISLLIALEKIILSKLDNVVKSRSIERPNVVEI